MEQPIQVAFRGMPHSEDVEQRCLAQAAKLEHYYDRITSCRVTVGRPHRSRQRGNLYKVRIDLVVPGGEIVVDRDPPKHHREEDLAVAIREAFDRARRRLEDFVRRRSGRDRLPSEPV